MTKPIRALRCETDGPGGTLTEGWFLGLVYDERGDAQAVVSYGYGMTLSLYHPSKVRLHGGAMPIGHV